MTRRRGTATDGVRDRQLRTKRQSAAQRGPTPGKAEANERRLTTSDGTTRRAEGGVAPVD